MLAYMFVKSIVGIGGQSKPFVASIVKQLINI